MLIGILNSCSSNSNNITPGVIYPLHPQPKELKLNSPLVVSYYVNNELQYCYDTEEFNELGNNLIAMIKLNKQLRTLVNYYESLLRSHNSSIIPIK